MTAPALATIPTLPTVMIPDQEICRVGRWNGRDYTRQDFEEVIKNNRELQGAGWDSPLITLGHDGEASAMGDGEPALGWVGNLRLVDDSLRGDYHRVPIKLAAFIKAGNYPKKSCTFLVNADIDGQTRSIVLQNVALLGGRQPAVDGLEDLSNLYANRRQLKAKGGTAVTIETTGTVSAALLARLPQFAGREQLASGPSYDSQRAAVQAALNATYEPSNPDTEGTEAGGTPAPSSTICMLYGDSVVVEDNDGDAYFEIPVTQGAAGAVQLGTPQMVELRPVPIEGTPSEATEVPGESESETPAENAAEPAAAGLEYNARQLAATVADSAVEDLVATAKAEFQKLIDGVNGIAAGKPGVTEFRSLVQAAIKSLDRIEVAKPADGDTPPPAAAAQNARQEEPDVQLKELAKKLGLPEAATEGEINRAIEGALTSRDVVQQLARRMDERDERDAVREVDQLIEAAVSGGKLKRFAAAGTESEQVGFVRKLAKVDIKLAREHIATLNPFVNTTESGRSGSDAGAPEVELTPGIQAELHKLGRDPATIDARPLGERWKQSRDTYTAAQRTKHGMPAR